ncbi:MAG: RNA polymerase sigma factor [Myxococcota bacterium]|nr:RNA polymerase sigma factor [Myxococcota bacterium]
MSTQAFEDTDQAILKLARRGQLKEACRLLTEAYGAEMLGSCIGRMGDPVLAQDAAQDTLARALVGLSKYQGEAGLRPWLHRIAANRCIDLLRSRTSRRKRTMDDAALDTLPGRSEPMPSDLHEAENERKRRVAEVRRALAQVKEPDRSWVELHYTHGVSYEEIAEDAEVSRAAVKQRIWRAVKRVRTLLAVEGERLS